MDRFGIRLVGVAMCAGLVLVSSGCWDRHEIETLAVATAVAADRAPGGRGLLLTGAFSIPSRMAGATGGAGGFGGGGGGGGGAMPFARTTSGPRGPTAWVVGTVAPTLAEALERLVPLSSRLPFWAHVRVIVVGEELASSGLRALLDAVLREREFRRTPWILVARGIPAFRILELSAPFAPSAEHLARLQETLRFRSAFSAPQRIHEFLTQYAQPGVDPVAPGITFEKPVPPDPRLSPPPDSQWPALARVEGTAVFRDDRLAGWLSPAESRALLLLQGSSRQFALSAPCPGSRGSVAVNVVRFTTQSRILPPGRAPDTGATAPASQRGDLLPRFAVEVVAEGTLSQETCEPSLDPDDLRRVGETLGAEMEEGMRQVIRKVHGELRADPVGFGLMIFRARPALWENLAPRWRTYLPQLEVSVKAQLRIRRTGLTSDGVRPR